MAIDVSTLSTRPLDPVIDEELVKFEQGVPSISRRRDRRGRLSRLPAEPGHLRPAPGRAQPDGAGQGPPRLARSRAARDARLPRRRVLARLGAPHHPPERADALRPARADARAPAPAGVGRPDDPGGVRRHRPQRDRLPPRWRLPVRGARHQPVGEGDDRLLPPQPVCTAHAAQVQDQLLGLRHRLRSGHVQRRRRHRREPAQAPTAPSSPASRCSWRAGSAPTRTRRRRSRSSRPASS